MEQYCFPLLVRKVCITLCITLSPEGHLHPREIILATLPSLGHTPGLSGIGLVKKSLWGSSLWGSFLQKNTKSGTESYGVFAA